MTPLLWWNWFVEGKWFYFCVLKVHRRIIEQEGGMFCRAGSNYHAHATTDIPNVWKTMRTT
jgi:hypothetical protein